jgi:AraC-like DNA-binding protein
LESSSVPVRFDRIVGQTFFAILIYLPVRLPMAGFTFFNAHSAVADIVDTIWDVDLPDAGFARSLEIKVLPTVAPTLCLHYRAAMDSDQRLNPGLSRQRGTGVQTRAVTVQPTGPIGAVNVHLRPQAASRIMGGCMEEFTDANITLSDIFGGLEVSLLEERIAEAETAAERVHCVQSFLHEQIGENRCDVIVDRAVFLLRRDPSLSILRLAAILDISERQLERRFRAKVGTNPKQFARIERLNNVIRARQRGDGWADIACSCGFNDQAHMIHDFNSMTHTSPETFFQSTAFGDFDDLNTALAKSGFCNTFVVSQ